MKFNENTVFLSVLLLAVVGGLIFYSLESANEGNKATTVVPLTTDLVPTMSTIATTSSTVSTSTIITSTTILPPIPSSTTTTAQPEILQDSTATTAPVTTSTNSPPPAQPNHVAAKFQGRGLHQAILGVHYFCPSCVPAVVSLLSNEPGILSKSFGYRQQVSYVIYNPKEVKIDRILELAGASGGAELINDTEI